MEKSRPEMFFSDQRKKLSCADVLKLKREMTNMLPENDPIQNRHNKDECKEYQVHDEANWAPNWAFYVQPAGSANPSIEILDVKSGNFIFVSFSREELG